MATTAATAASQNLLHSGSRRRVGTAKTAPEPWFALNRNAYQAILNVALAEMTSSSSSTIGVSGTGEVSRGKAGTGSELLRLPHADDDFGKKRVAASSTVVENCSRMTSDTRTGNDSRGSLIASSEMTSRSYLDGIVTSAIPASTKNDVKIELDPNITVMENHQQANVGEAFEFEDGRYSRHRGTDCRQLPALRTSNECGNGLPGTIKIEPAGENGRSCENIGVAKRMITKLLSLGDKMSTTAVETEPSMTGDVSTSFVDVEDAEASYAISPPNRNDALVERKSPIFIKPELAASTSFSEPMSPPSIDHHHIDSVVTSDQKPIACWIPIDKDVVATIIDRELTQRPSTDRHLSSLSPSAGQSSPFPVAQPHREENRAQTPPTSLSFLPSATSATLLRCADGAAAPVQVSPPAAHRSRLLADLLHQTDDFSGSAIPEVASIAAARKRQSTPIDFTSAVPQQQSASRKSDWSPTKKPKWSIDEATDNELLSSAAGSLSKSRVQVQSTWPIPGTTVDRRMCGASMDGYFTTTRNQFPSSPIARCSDGESRRRSGPTIGLGHAGLIAHGCGRDPPLPAMGVQTTGLESSQVWTAIDKTLVLDVIDQLLDLDVDDDDLDDAEESAIDLTVVRQSDGRSSSNGALSQRDLMALFSCGSAAYRMQAQSFRSERGNHRRRVHVDETGNDGEFEFGIGVGDSSETSSQLKWKSNIMQRMRREQTTIAHGVTMSTPSGEQVWRRGGSSIAATGS